MRSWEWMMLRKKLNHSLPWNEDLHGRGLSSSNCCCAFFLLDLQQALASGGFPIAVPLQANAINTQAQGGMTVNG